MTSRVDNVYEVPRRTPGPDKIEAREARRSLGRPDLPRESFADPEVASDFLEDFAGNNFDYCGPDEYRLLSANWRDRSKADAFVAKGVRRDMFMNGQDASADRFLAW